MGITYKAFDTNLRCFVALKVINAAYLNSEIARQRFLREARAAAAPAASECRDGLPPRQRGRQLLLRDGVHRRRYGRGLQRNARGDSGADGLGDCLAGQPGLEGGAEAKPGASRHQAVEPDVCPRGWGR